MNSENTPRRPPLSWVPTLYFAEGLPNYLVGMFSLSMYQALGVSNAQITALLGLIGFVWVVKPLWSPFLEAAPSKKAIVIACQLAGGIAIGALTFTLGLSHYLVFGIVVLTIVAIASATHDIAADGLYIASLSKKQQADYSGWQGCFYNLAKVAAIGGMFKLVDYWHTEAGYSVLESWQYGLGIVAVIMIALALYHYFTLPIAPSTPHEKVMETLLDVIKTFFQKPGIWLAIAFMLIFRLAEGQIQSIGPLFLLDAKAAGGLGIALGDQATIYGIYGTIAFIVGSILGGYFGSWLGLKRTILILILAMNLPNVTFYYLSLVLPTDFTVIKIAVTVEMFGYGFGFTALMLYMMQVVAPGKYPTAHYALCTGINYLGLTLSRIVSGSIQEKLGYHNFFVWVLICTIPIVLIGIILPIRSNAQRQAQGLEESTEPAIGPASDESLAGT